MSQVSGSGEPLPPDGMVASSGHRDPAILLLLALLGLLETLECNLEDERFWQLAHGVFTRLRGKASRLLQQRLLAAQQSAPINHRAAGYELRSARNTLQGLLRRRLTSSGLN